MRTQTVAACCLLGASVAMGQNYRTYAGQGGPIRDLTDQRFTVFVPEHGSAYVPNRITLDIQHTWAGDLYIEFRHKTPNDYNVILLDRPGVPQSTFGNSDNLDGVYSFHDDGAPFSEVVGATGFVPPGTYAPPAGQRIFRPVQDAFGEWSLFIADRAAGDEGVLRSWELEMWVMPSPGSASVLAAALMIGRRRR